MKKFFRNLYLTLITCLSIGSISNAQINTPAGATNPFGSNLSYGFGIMPTNLPTGGAFGKSQDAADAYNEWKGYYVDQTCVGGTQARVKFDDLSKTVSEGIAYGMLLSAYAADKPLFDKLWAYYKANSNGNGIMNWKINGCSGTEGWNGATDAELDAAMALIVAETQWPTINTPYDYAVEASTLITKIKTFEVDGSSYQAINGDGWGFGNTCRNPSYQSPAYYKAFSNHNTGESAFWNNAINGAYTLLNANAHATTGLVSDWCNNFGVRNTCNGGYDGYGYDASRNPWRMGVDAIWWNNTNAVNICNKLATYINSQGATNVRGPRNQDGTGGGNHNALFVSTYASALVGSGAGNQTILNNMYTETKNVKDNLQAGYPSGYFGNTLRCISLFVMTGNFWKPGTQASQEINVKVETTDVPHNSAYDFQNVLFSSNKSVVFTIENKGSVQLNLTGSPLVNVTSGGANFSVTAQPGTNTITGGATTTFTVLFTPVSNGLKTGTISIANNDSDENPYIINLTGTGTPSATNAEIGVSQNAVNINTGGTFNLGGVTQNATTYVLFTINNTGDSPLNISSTVVSAGNGYTLDVAPAASVAASGSTTFKIKFTPTSTGTKTGTITISNNDPDETSFVINLTANATTCAVSITNTSVIQDYDANNNVALAFSPVGTLNQALVNPVINTTNPSFTVAQYVRSTGNDYDVIRYNACAPNYVLTSGKPIISMLVYSPQLGVPITLSAKKTGPVGPIFPDYSSDKTLYTTKINQWERLYFDFSNVVSSTSQFVIMDIMIDPLRTKLGAVPADRTYMIDDIRFDSNPCITDLPASEIFNDYDDHKNVSLAYNPVGAFNPVYSNPASGGLNTSPLVARYDRPATGTYDGIRYNACSGTIDFTGKTTISFLIYSPTAGIDVILSTKMADGPDPDSYLDAVLDVTTKTTVANQWQRLYFDFDAIKNNNTVLAFDIMIDPLATAGVLRTYYIDDIKYDINPCYSGIASSGIMQDYNNNRFLDMSNVNLAFNDLIANPSATGINTSSTVGRLIRPATGTYNLIRYKPCGSNFDLSPGKTVYAMDVYSPVANLPIKVMLKLANGTTTLVEDSAIVVSPNTWTTVTFDFTSAFSSNLGAYLDIYLDPNIIKGAQTYYIDNIRFSNTTPEINVRQNTTNILTGGSYDFGSVNVSSSSPITSFTIQNNGTGNLILSGSPIVSKSGANAADFVIDQTTTISNVGPVSSTSFTITFTPSAAGVRAATISITNNDSDENPYIINLTGTGVCALPGAAGVITGNAITCSGTTGVTYSITAVSGATGYNWTVPTGASITAGTNTTGITVTFGSTSGNVTVTPTNTCGNGTLASKAVTVNPPASAAGAITGLTTVCSGQAGVTYSITAVAGATGYNWTVPTGSSITAGTNTNSITVTFASTAGNITVTPTSTCGNGAMASQAITIATAASAAGAITGPTTVCSGQASVVYSITPVSGATGYNWTVPTGSSITAGTNTSSITVTFGSTAGNIAVTPTSTCGNGASNSVAITLSGSANPAGAITGLTSVCNGATGVTYSIASVSGATGYNWTVPTGASITAGINTTGITVTFGTNSGNVTVTPTSTCGSGASSSTTIAVNGPAGAAGTISGPTSACNGATGLVYSIVAVAGASGYDWVVPSGSTITAGTNTTSITMTFGGIAGNISVTPTATCGNGTVNNLAVTVFSGSCVPPTTQTISGPTSVTTGQTVTYTVATAPVGSTYSWTLPTGTTIVSTNGDNSSITVLIGSTSGNIVLTETNAAGSTNSSLPIAVSPATGIGSAITGIDTYEVYPTPFEYSTTVRVNSIANAPLKIKIMDSKGIIVYTSNDYITNQDINVGKELKSGIYYVEVSYQNKVQVLRLVKL